MFGAEVIQKIAQLVVTDSSICHVFQPVPEELLEDFGPAHRR